MNQFSFRRYIISGIILLVGLVYIIRLFGLQVLDPSYKNSASNNVLRYVPQYPARGLIYDRNGKLLVYNEAAYDLMVYPQQLDEFDTLELATVLQVDVKTIRDGISKARAYSRYKPSVILKQLSSETYAVLQEKMYKFPGFAAQPRTLRKYAYPSAAHVLGYVGEVNQSIMEKNPYYKLGDYIGISGIEKTYEESLRGKKGVKIYLVDVHNNIKGSYQDGLYDTAAVVGKNIRTTLDIDLQTYGEKLMENKIGSIVALEPSTGEILAMVSAPDYDPELLVGRVRGQNYSILSQDTLNPLFNRAVMAQYPPGSTFKLITGMLGLQEGVLRTGTQYECYFGYHAPGHSVGCHAHASPLNLPEAVQNSCNAYFCYVFRNLLDRTGYGSIQESFDNWLNHVESFGFGKRLGSDIPAEVNGILPSSDFYNRIYGERGWKSITVISLAIGQGELGITPIQMANMSATIANRGYYFTPHIVSEIDNLSNQQRFYEKNYTTIDSINYEPVIEGMRLAVNGGAGSTARIAAIKDIVVAGKTGTAENPHGEDHSIFVAFAPIDDPKIALAVYVENAGFGTTWAAPIASLMIEKYLHDTISRGWLEKRILDAKLLDRSRKEEESAE